MNQYKVFKHLSGTSEVVKQGWSWPAFFFLFIWAMVKKMWGLGVGGVFISPFVFGFIVGATKDGIGGIMLIDIVAIIVSFVFGGNGNSWREKNLVSRGFEQVDTVTAANPENAVALWLKATNAER